jgi:hypothetical protein
MTRSTQFCSTCGAANALGDLYCFACGRSLEQEEEPGAIPDVPLLHERYQPGGLLGEGGSVVSIGPVIGSRAGA